MNDNTTDVLVIGAGPTGLTAAAEAIRHGLTVRIVERRAERAQISKALVLHARTMEALEAMGCAEALLEAGQTFRGLHVHITPKARIFVDLVDRNWGDTRYPFWLSVPQYETERILEEHLEHFGGKLEWNTELLELEDHGEIVVARLRTPGGVQEHRARWVLGCDGGRSKTREEIGVPLPRKTLGVKFALADVWTRSDLAEDEGHVVQSADRLLLIVPMPERGVWRLIAHVKHDQSQLSQTEWNDLVLSRSGIDLNITKVGWNTEFDLSSGVAERFRRGRVFLLGDAGHVHSPVGGQGLNTGVQDAQNLVWKLALSMRTEMSAEDGERLLNTYDAERRPIAQSMVRDTGRATFVMTQTNPLIRWVLDVWCPECSAARRYRTG